MNLLSLNVTRDDEGEVIGWKILETRGIIVFVHSIPSINVLT